MKKSIYVLCIAVLLSSCGEAYEVATKVPPKKENSDCNKIVYKNGRAQYINRPAPIDPVTHKKTGEDWLKDNPCSLPWVSN